MSQFITKEESDVGLFFIGFLLSLIGGSGAIEVGGFILTFIAIAVVVLGFVLMYLALVSARNQN